MIQFILYFVLLIFPSNQIDESKTLIIFFSRAGENYNVGIVDKGNTEMIVDYITQVTKIKSFKINPETEYPINYTETIQIARNEKNTNARPKIKDPLTNIDNYDTILLGYPIWHTDLPNIVMTQLELLDFEGKTIYPFNTHEGSGTGNSINDIKNLVPKADVKDGFALRGQNARKEEYRSEIDKWLKEDLGLQINQNIPDSPVSTTQPIVKTTQPIVTITQPVVSTTQPIVSTTQPIVSTTQPSVSTTQPSGNTTQPGNTTLPDNTTGKNNTEDDEINKKSQRNTFSNLLNISMYIVILIFMLIFII